MPIGGCDEKKERQEPFKAHYTEGTVTMMIMRASGLHQKTETKHSCDITYRDDSRRTRDRWNGGTARMPMRRIRFFV